MPTRARSSFPLAMRLLLLLLFLMPLFVLFLLPSGGLVLGRGWFWLALGATFFLFWLLNSSALRAKGITAVPHGGPRMLYRVEHPALVHDLMDVQWAQEER